ncbi:phospholipase D-like domain-containing protein [Chryseosolibacter indicus]|uniref:phospholipase D n=1 Tax=Chryseosolibacter indicus TaxID=2782351 RepID=A0ABS5VV00_9BACT|nr:phospholipase D-like domain-containing protein [Chryseosolibacter indicus]MBT1705156.1 DUF1669 domain-containing protein [Chryseosolibacter indicus]
MTDILTNGTEIKQRIISEIDNARQGIYLAMAWFTDRDIANAFIKAKRRNVIVDVVLSSNAQNEIVKQMLIAANINVHAFQTGDERGTMHHKFCLIDNKISINGSFNYSYNASNNNVENIHVSDDYDIYRQLFSEFERIRYNIDNNIAVNTIVKDTNPEQTNPMQSIQPTNPDTFYQQLYNLVYSSAQINTEDFKRKGFQKSKESVGNIDIFESEYLSIKEEIKVFATDDSLVSKKNILLANITNAFETKKAELEIDKEKEINAVAKSNDLEKRQLTDKTSSLQQEKTILESGNQNTGEKGLLQLNKEIERIKLDKKSLEQSFVIKEFWSTGTILVTLLLAVLAFYLSLFFASAMYKVFFEGNVIRKALEAGGTPGLPQLVDANAILKIFRQQGALFGFIAAIFFLFPVLISNIKLFGSEKKWVSNVLFWVGLLIFDIVVAAMVAFNTDEIKSLLKGEESHLKIWQVVEHGEFWLMFVFGMMPLIVTHYAIDNIYNAYRNSQRHLVDAEKEKKIKILDEEMLDLDANREAIINRIKQKEDALKESNDKILKLEVELDALQNHIHNRYIQLLRPIKTIFDDFNAKVISGKIFTDEILLSVVSAYKSGFIEYLPTYFSEDEVANRVVRIEQVIAPIK